MIALSNRKESRRETNPLQPFLVEILSPDGQTRFYLTNQDDHQHETVITSIVSIQYQIRSYQGLWLPSFWANETGILGQIGHTFGLRVGLGNGGMGYYYTSEGRLGPASPWLLPNGEDHLDQTKLFSEIPSRIDFTATLREYFEQIKRREFHRPELILPDSDNKYIGENRNISFVGILGELV